MTLIQRNMLGRSLCRARRSLVPLLMVLFVSIGVVSTGSRASAAPSASAQARSLFREARRLMDKGSYADACPKLQESLRIDPGMGTHFNLAHCWEQIGLTASAWGAFLDVAAAAAGTGQSKREKAARERAAALEPKLSRLRIDVSRPTPGMKVSRSGEEVGQGAWGEAMPIDPGTYHIEASAPEKRPWSGDVVVETPGATASIEVPPLEDLVPPVVEAPPVAEPTPAPVSVEDRGSSTGHTVATLLVGAAGIGGVVAGIVYGLEARNETKAARALCTGGPGGSVCNRDESSPTYDGGTAERDELYEHRDAARRAALISYVGFGVGAAGIVGSTLLLITGSGDDDEDAGAAQLVPTLGPGHAGVRLSGHF
jgi:hypothetical protein